MTSTDKNQLPTSFSLRLLEYVIWLVMALIALPILNLAYRALAGQPYQLNMLDIQIPQAKWALAAALTLFFEWAAWLLLRVVRRARRGQIFTLQNSRDLQRIGNYLFGAWLIPLLLHLFQTNEHLIGGELSPVALLRSPFTLSLVFYVFAEVLREGVRLRDSEQRLREEQQLTI